MPESGFSDYEINRIKDTRQDVRFKILSVLYLLEKVIKTYKTFLILKVQFFNP